MRRYLLVVPIALALLALWILKDDDAVTRAAREADGIVEQPRAHETSSRPPRAPPINRKETGTRTVDPNGSAEASVRGRKLPKGLEVRVRNDLGDPEPGVRIVLQQGEVVYDLQLTDGSGRAYFSPSYRVATHVVAAPGSRDRWHVLGVWDGKPGNTRIDGTIFRRRNVLLRVRVDGAPRFPPGFELEAPRIEGLQLFQSAGELRGQLVTFTRNVPLGVKPCPPFLADREQFLLLDNDGLLEAAIDYETGVPVDVWLPDREFASDLRIEEQQSDGTWYVPFGWPAGPLSCERSASIRMRIGLRPGQYRVVLDTLGVVVKEFEVPADEPAVRLDLRRLTLSWVAPSFRLPKGYRNEQAVRVFVRGKDVLKFLRGKRFLHPGDRVLTLTIAGSGLRPDPRDGVREISRGGRVVLRARADASATVRCDTRGTVTLGLRSVEPPYAWEYTAAGRRSLGDLFLFENVPEGTFLAVVTPTKCAPTLVGEVAIADGAVHLGDVVAHDGMELDILYRNRKGRTVSIRATWLPIDKPISLVQEAKGDRVVLRNLPSGGMRLDFRMGRQRWSRVVPTNGSGKSSIEVDCGGD